MRTLILALSLVSLNAFAIPVFNKNMAAEGTFVTIWPDHMDTNHFYFAPNLMTLSVDDSGKTKFNLTKYFGGCNIFRVCNEKAMLNAFFVAGYRKEQLAAAQAGILKRYPNAFFSPVPYLASRVDFGKTLTPFIEHHDCAPMAGQAADEVPCSMTLSGRGINTLIPRLNEGTVFPFKFYYKISGVVQKANGQFEDDVLDYSIVVNLGGEILIGHEDLSDQ